MTPCTKKRDTRGVMTLLILACAATPSLPLEAAAASPATAPVEDQHDATVATGVPGQLYTAAQGSDRALSHLRYLSDHIGHRIIGSDALDRAEQWAAEGLEADGFEVRLEPVETNHWVRGEESLHLLAPVERELPLLGLGGTVATPPGGIQAEVVAVADLDALDALPDDAVAGRIVLYDQPWSGYRDTVQARLHGADRAAAKGAVAALVRSVTDNSLGAPHTGAMHYSDDAPRIPAAAVTVEDAAWLHRLVQDGVRPQVRLVLGARDAGTVVQHNVIADLPGREHPDQVVVVACHLDSWDVGQGAQDDGAGCMIAWEAARLISLLPERPRRTIRVVLYTAEERGISGGSAYAAARSPEEIAAHVALLESDTGNGRANGFRVDLRTDDAQRRAALDVQLAAMSAALGPVGVTELSPGYSGADIGKVVELGPLGLGLNHDLAHYWEIHHTAADTFDKVVPEDLAHNVGIMAATAWWLAEEWLAEEWPAEEAQP